MFFFERKCIIENCESVQMTQSSLIIFLQINFLWTMKLRLTIGHIYHVTGALTQDVQ